MPADINLKVNKRDLKRVKRTLGKLPDNLQRKVLIQASRRTVRSAVLPAVKDKINARSFDPPEWNAVRGKGPRHQSHTGPPGILKRKMRVIALKRSRVRVGHTVTTPTRDQLGIPEWSKAYYPAFLEYGKTGMRGATMPQPYLRGTFRQELTSIERDFVNHTKARMKYLKSRGA